MQQLQTLLINSGLTKGYTGQSINNSSLSGIKRFLTGQPGFMGMEKYLLFGSEFHKRELEPDKPWTEFSPEEEYALRCMLESLRGHKEYQKYRKNAVTEEKVFGEVHGVPAHGTLDLQTQLRKDWKVSHDLKTTSTRTQREFEQTALKYDYIRQSNGVYMPISRAQEFIFWGVQKKEPFHIFPFRPSDFSEYIRYALEETKFLMYFYRQFGLPHNVTITQ